MPPVRTILRSTWFVFVVTAASGQAEFALPMKSVFPFKRNFFLLAPAAFELDECNIHARFAYKFGSVQILFSA